MKKKLLLLSGIIGSIICIVSYGIFSYLNPEYDDLRSSFSSLGSIGQPNSSLYSVFSFIIPGILLVIFSLNLKNYINNGEVKNYPFILITLSAVLIAIGGAPMNYDDFLSITSILHIFGVMSSGLVFMIGGFTISKQLKKDENWKPLIKPLVFLVWILIVSSFFRSSEMKGLAQKIGILAYYIYFSLLSWNAYKIQHKNED